MVDLASAAPMTAQCEGKLSLRDHDSSEHAKAEADWHPISLTGEAKLASLRINQPAYRLQPPVFSIHGNDEGANPVQSPGTAWQLPDSDPQ